jgi:endonuclease/exonuclease/phosphatase (EEP) superfamily protein YafD
VPRFTSEPPPDQLAGSARLRVMTVNAHVGQLDQGELLRTLNQERPDLLVLTEVPEATLERFEAAGLRDLLPGKAARPGPGADGTAIYARAALALRDAGDAGGETIFRNPRATVELAGRTATIQAAHPPPPLPIASAIDIWRRDLRLLARSAAATSGPLIALGDFNASVDHAGFRALLADGRLRDAHDARGRGLVATWPATDGAGLPRFAHIDHVLVSREFAVLGVHERELPLLDHSVVVADLALLEG